MNSYIKKKTIMKKNPSFVSFRQRIVGLFTVAVMLLQICMPTIAWAATLLTNESITASMTSPSFQKSSSNSYLYEQASFDEGAHIGSQNITTFRERLVADKSNLGKPTFVPIVSDITIFIPTYPTGKLIGDAYVQSRYIRQQVFDLLGRHLIYANSKNISETSQINTLYDAAYAFAKKNPAINFGANLDTAILANLTADMIWPEARVINGENVVVPIVYLTDITIRDNKVTKTQTEFTGSAVNLGSITLNHAELTLGANTIVKTAGNLTASKESLIASGGDINLVVGGTLNLIGSSITGVKDVNILANEINVKSVLVPFQDRYGSGTKLGSIASINSAAGNISLTSTGNVTFEASTATASNGTLTIKADGNISILPLFATYQGQSTQNDWKVNSSSLDVIGSRLSAKDKITLISKGGIEIQASELISTQGGIELLAQQGIFILDELTQEQIQKVDRKGKTTGQSSEFRSEAVRSILKAGKGVLLYSEFGDVVLKATEITSATGTQVTAENGKVNLLMTKELEERHLQTVSKGTWTIKTRTEDVIHENNIQNAIVGGLQVQAKYGINVEYTGKVDATLKEQIDEYRAMPEMRWIADLYDQSVVAGGQSVNWDVIEEVHKELKKTKRNLSPAAMAIIAIAVCVAMGPAGAGLIGSGGSISVAVGNATLGAALSAGAVTLTTQAAQSLAAGNDLRKTLSAMDSSENLKSLAVAMATAGAMQAAQLDVFKVPEGSSIDALNLAKQAGQVVVDSTVSAGVSISINGGNSDAFKKAFSQAIALNVTNDITESLAKKIGAAAKLPDAERISIGAQYISHAAVGCLRGSLSANINGGEVESACYSGAGGAVVGEAVGQYFEQKLNDKLNAWVRDQLSQDVAPSPKIIAQQFEFFRLSGVDLSKLSAAFAAFATGGNIDIAASAAENAAKNNALKTYVDLEAFKESIKSIFSYLGADATNDLAQLGRDSQMYVAWYHTQVDEAYSSGLISQSDYFRELDRIEYMMEDAGVIPTTNGDYIFLAIGAATAVTGTRISIKTSGGKLVAQEFGHVDFNLPSTPVKGAVSDANFAQKEIRTDEMFSAEGIKSYSALAGSAINSVDDLVTALKLGKLKPNQVPVDYVVHNGNKLILNTRTSVALERAGIPRQDWHGSNKTNMAVPGMDGKTYNDLAQDQLSRNKLPETGWPEVPYNPKKK